MSLLLDALKKAAEKKAKKGSDNTERVDRTEVDPTEVDRTDIDHTETLVDDSRFSTTQGYDETEVTDALIMGAAETEPDQDTRTVEVTDETLPIDHTETLVDESRLSTTQRYDETDLTDTVIADTGVTELDEVTKTVLDTDKTETIDQTETLVDESRFSAHQHDDTEATDAVLLGTATTKSDRDTQTADTVEIPAAGPGPLKLEPLDQDQTEEKTEVDVTGSETLIEMPALGIEDTDLLNQDDDIVELQAETVLEDDQTQTDMMGAQSIAEDALTDFQEDLTEDDVTEFMGDGIRDEQNNIKTNKPEHTESTATSEDTTFTHPNSLNLTDIEYDEELELEDKSEITYSVAEDTTKTNTHSLHGYDGRIPADESGHENLTLEDIQEEDKETIFNTESRIPSVDIDKLTNDETVTVKSATPASTRTFAPDNYDRTLLNLSDRDVSKIFPGLRPESDTVITPDYAKKVFMSKSSKVKSKFYRMYAGLAFVLLLAIAVWGLFQIQDESDMIDRSLISLKRDPMPGMIKPKIDEEPRSLFAQQSLEANSKAIDLISLDDDATAIEALDETSVASDRTPIMSPESTFSDIGEAGEGQVKKIQEISIASKTTGQPTSTTARVTSLPTAKISASAKKAPKKKALETKADAPTSRPASTPLQVSISSRVSDKDRLLSSAYAAYERGELELARRNYERVLKQDADNRDALLGRAAIHILQNEYPAAILSYQQLLLANPKDSIAMTSLISVANIDPTTGESQLKSLLREQPESPYLHFVLGNMYGIQSRWSEAQGSYFNALQIKPRDPNYAYNLAVSLEHLGKPETAVSFYQQALENQSSGLATFDSQLVNQRIEVLSQ